MKRRRAFETGESIVSFNQNVGSVSEDGSLVRSKGPASSSASATISAPMSASKSNMISASMTGSRNSQLICSELSQTLPISDSNPIHMNNLNNYPNELPVSFTPNPPPLCCAVCALPASPQNDFTMCSNCGRCYHSQCHAPHPPRYLKNIPGIEWKCTPCTKIQQTLPSSSANNSISQNESDDGDKNVSISGMNITEKHQDVLLGPSKGLYITKQKRKMVLGIH